MSLRLMHLWIGLAGVAVFLLSGIYMRLGFPALYEANEVIRYLYRANHVYLLLASLVNLIAGCYLTVSANKSARVTAMAGSILMLLSPFVLTLAFAHEAALGVPERPVTFFGVLMMLLGVLSHLLSRLPRR